MLVITLLAAVAQSLVINQQQPALFTVVEKSLLDLIYEHPDLKKASKLIQERPSIENALKGSSKSLTVFVPTDSALEKVKQFPYDETTQVLLYHVVDKVYESDKLVQGVLLESGLSLETLGDQGQKIKITTEHGIIQLNYHSHVFERDLKANNGVLHTLDRILVPPPNLFTMIVHDFREFGGYGLALKLCGLSHLVKQATAATVFAPTNKAFRKLGARKLAYLFGPLGRAHLVNVILSSISPSLWYSKDILDKGDFSVPTMNGKLHLVVKDGDVKAGDAFVDKFDVLAMNGVMHGLDTVLESSTKNELLSESDFTESDEFFKQIFY